MRSGVLNARLLSAADFVRQGAVFADIGTDHAHLPIFLLERGQIVRAVCSDINEGPLRSAMKNAEERGYTDRCEFVLCDGARALSEKGITDIAVCGMGGELIAKIISESDIFYDEEINLVLQPMSKAGTLRKFLLSEGFEIECEAYSEDGGKRYVCLNVKYTKVRRDINAAEAEIGLENVKIVNKDVQKLYLSDKIRSLTKAIVGKKLGGECADEELLVLNAARARLEKLEEAGI